MISLNNIYKSYDKGETFVIQNLSFEVSKGDFISIIGDSGVGKTTLLNILATIDGNYNGKYVFGKSDISKYNDTKISKFRNANIGVIFQNYNLVTNLDVKNNILLPAILGGKETKGFLSNFEELSKTFNIYDLKDKMVGDLSGGEMQRVAVVRALINEPDLILADEPTGNLDSKNTDILFDLLHKINTKGQTVILATHDEQLARRFDKCYRLSGKRLSLVNN